MREARARPAHALAAAIALGMALASASPVLAHRDDYFDETLVYLTLARGEIEPEYWLDAARTDGAVRLARHHFALEYGVTNHGMLDSRVTFTAAGPDRGTLESGRFESRLRFLDEGALPVDLAASLEVNTRREADGSHAVALEPRLIASRDFREFNLTANLAEEVPTGGGEASFEPALAARYGSERFVRIAAELKYSSETRGGAFVPQVWFAFPHDLTLKLGVSRGLGRDHESFGRVALELEL